MPTCNVCGLTFFKANALIKHLKYIHYRCQENSLFICAEKNCKRNFPSLNSFRKHLKCHECSDISIPEKSPDNVIPSCSHNKDIPPVTSFSQLTNEKDSPNVTNFFSQNETLPAMDDTEQLLKKFKECIKCSNVRFISKLYSENSFCRKDVDKIMNYVGEFFYEPLNIFKKYLLEYLKCDYNISNCHTDILKTYFNEMQDIFKGFDTEYLRFKYLENSGFYIKPVDYVIGENLEQCTDSVPKPRKLTAQFIPMGDVLHNFFSLPGILFETIKYNEYLKYKLDVYNIIQTDFWKSKTDKYKNHEIVFPLFIYYDDFESGNPLGSHSGIHKIGAIYFSIACLPPKFQSRLENIFLANLFHSSDLKEFGEQVIFSKLIDELNNLENNGITVTYDSKEIHIYFCVALFLGDNLALNSILGFQESFSANSFCRFCKSLKTDTQKMTFPDNNALRNKQNYNDDLIIGNPYLTGIKFSSCLNNITSFHVTENYCVDVAHDIFEGIGVYIMGHLLHQFVFIDNVLPFDVLNNKIKYFNFSHNHNRPPLITYESLKKKNIRMSAAEMKAFIVNGGLIFGSLIPEGNHYWQLYILLRKILKIILSDFVNVQMCNELTELIHKHHTLFIELFPDIPLKPKFHILLHYPLILLKTGPVARTMTLRYESKHRQSKISCNVVSSRVNITHTLSIKHQLQLASRFIDNKGLVNVSKGTYRKDSETCLPIIREIVSKSKFSTLIDFEYLENIGVLNRLSYNSVVFCFGDVILIDTSPKFGLIKFILTSELDQYLFIYNDIDILNFSNHLFAFEINVNENSYDIIMLEDISHFDSYKIISLNDKKYITI